MALGDIYFYHGNGGFGKLIQWRTGGPYEHTCVEVEGGKVIEAKWPLVSLDVVGKPTATYKTSEKCDPEKVRAGVAWLHTMVGHHYSFWNIIVNGIGIVLPHKRSTTIPTMFICSELATWFLIESGYPFPAGFVVDEDLIELISPNELARIVGILPR